MEGKKDRIFVGVSFFSLFPFFLNGGESGNVSQGKTFPTFVAEAEDAAE